MKQILITNDDGFDSLGLLSLVEALKPLAKVTVVAPSSEKSACGHSLTLTKPLRFIKVKESFYKLEDGTPSDCIFLALNEIFYDKKPDLVISGINVGANMGEDITYSGTAAGAMEAVLQGIPALAISQVYKDGKKSLDTFGYELAQEAIVTLVKKIWSDEFPLPKREFININIPPVCKTNSNGFKVTRAGNKLYGCHAESFLNPRGDKFYWIGLPRLDWMENRGFVTDFEAVQNGYISLTPVKLDMTSHEEIDSLKSWIE